ncbi:MAG: hypothetical protein AABM42_10650 [Actinomycetota bacterium]
MRTPRSTRKRWLDKGLEEPADGRYRELHAVEVAAFSAVNRALGTEMAAAVWQDIRGEFTREATAGDPDKVVALDLLVNHETAEAVRVKTAAEAGALVRDWSPAPAVFIPLANRIREVRRGFWRLAAAATSQGKRPRRTNGRRRHTGSAG